MQETVTETQVNEMLQLADLDKDGKINYEGIQSFAIDLNLERTISVFFFKYFRICTVTPLKWCGELNGEGSDCALQWEL